MGEIFEVNPRRHIKRGEITPFIPMDALSEYSRSPSRIDQREFNGSGVKFQKGDILLARITPCLENGKTAYISDLPETIVAHGSTEYIVITGKPNLSDSLFGYYLARSQNFRTYAIGHMEGTSGRQRVPSDAVEKFEFNLPSLDEQRVIAHILGTLDDKIELNRQINKTLEHIAQAMFKSWFVDFEPVKAKIAAIEAGEDQHGITRAAMRALRGKTDAELDALQAAHPDRYLELKTTAELFPAAMQESTLGEIPDEWTVKPLPEIIDINPTRQLRKGAIAPYLDMANVPTNSARVQNILEREFGSGSKFVNGDTLLARITPCLENGKTAFVDFLHADQVGWGSTEFIVLRPKQFLPVEFAYFLCRHPAFRDFTIANMAGTSGRQRVPNDCFQNYIFALPSQPIAEVFGRLTGEIMADIKALDVESRTLAMLRDILLPRLLSGELEVSVLPEDGG